MKIFTISNKNGPTKSNFEELNTNNRSPPIIQVNTGSEHEMVAPFSASTIIADVTFNKFSAKEIDSVVDKADQLKESVLEEVKDLQDINPIDLTADDDSQYYLLAANKVALEANLENQVTGQSSDDESNKQPWWMTNSTGSEGMNFLPWLFGGAAGIGTLLLVSGDNNKDNNNNSNANSDTAVDNTVNQPVDGLDDKPTDTPTNKPVEIVANKPTDTLINQPVDTVVDKPTDTTINPPIISIDDITGDNRLNDTDLTQSTVAITGKLTGLDPDVDTSKTNVTLTINDKSYTAAVTGNTFSANVASSDLKAADQLTAKATVTDNDDNTATSEVLTKAYTIQVEPIIFNVITGDNHINTSEAEENLIISGKADISYQGKNIEIVIGDDTYDALVKPDGTFSLTVAGFELISINNYQIFAQYKGNVDSKVSHTYTIADYVAANIKIDAIVNETPINIDNQLIRLSGFLDVTNTAYAKGANVVHVKAINIKIGDTIYNAGINEETQNFHIDVKLSDINKANGTAISYSVETSNKILEVNPDLFFGYEYDKVIELIEAPTLNENNTEIVFSENLIIQTNGSIHQIDNSAITDLLTTNITGTAGGTAQMGDEVTVEVAGRIYNTILESDNSFSVDIDTSDLTGVDTSNIKATLTTKDLANNTISVSNETNYSTTPKDDSTMVSWTGKLLDYQDLPYFIQVLDVETYQTDSYYTQDFGYLMNHNHGNEFGKHTINYYFATAIDGYGYSTSNGSLLNPIDYTQANKLAVNESLEFLEKYIDVDFNLIDSMSNADISYFMADLNGGDIQQNNVSYTTGYASYGGNVHLSAEFYGDKSNSLGSLNTFDGFSTLVHETMHTLGAKHSFEEDIGSIELKPSFDSTGLTLMSYMIDNDFSDNYDLRIYDLAYLQYRFGVNPNERAGNDVYTFKTFNQNSADGDIYIWDGDGIDVFDASQEQQGVYVDLTPGSNIYNNINNANFDLFAVQGILIDKAKDYLPAKIYTDDSYIVVEKDEFSSSYLIYSEVETVYDFTEGHSFIGYGTQIENLNGSLFDDILIGNQANNAIYGSDGNDTIDGGDGNDYIDGGNDSDTMNGGNGNDIFIVNQTGDSVIELAHSGIDSIYASVDFKLGANVENLVLIGNTLEGIGNELDNIIEGNNLDNTLNGSSGNDVLLGGSGNDILTGGSGSDIFIFDSILDGSFDTITDFNTVEADFIQLDSSIFDSLNRSDSSSLGQFINYNSITGVISYDSDGSDIQDPIHFATVSEGLTFDNSWFSVI